MPYWEVDDGSGVEAVGIALTPVEDPEWAASFLDVVAAPRTGGVFGFRLVGFEASPASSVVTVGDFLPESLRLVGLPVFHAAVPMKIITALAAWCQVDYS